MEKQIDDILFFIYENYETLTVTELAKHFGYTEAHFSREFKRYNGVGAAEYISSVRVFHSIGNLPENKSLVKSHLDVGYLSSGTFTNTFQKKTNLPPKKYKSKIPELHNFMQDIENDSEEVFEYCMIGVDSENRLEVELQLPEGFQGICFIGLFKKRIPNHTPVMGKASKKSTTLIFENIPNGQYYLMSCGIPKSLNPLNYFFLKGDYRAFIKQPFNFINGEVYSCELKLRKKLPTDPPLTINLPNLLLSQIRTQK